MAINIERMSAESVTVVAQSGGFVSRNSEINWGDEGPVSELNPRLGEVVFPRMDEAAIRAKRDARRVKDVAVVRANGLQSLRLETIHSAHANGGKRNGTA